MMQRTYTNKSNTTYATLVSWVSAVALEHPDKIAVIEDEHNITYSALERLSNSIAAHLILLNPNKSLRAIGIAEENTIQRIIVLLGILKTGAAYVPLDVAYPKERIQHIIDNAMIDVVIANENFTDNFKSTTAQLISVNKLMGLAHKYPKTKPMIDINETSPVHILFTSGSTGKPKGVIGSNRAIINRFQWALREFPINDGDILCHKTSLNFIPSVWEIFGPLITGCSVVLIKTATVKNISEFVEILIGKKINRIILIPSLLDAIMDHACHDKMTFEHLTLWMTSGEPLTYDTALRFKRCFPEATLVNIYGSTEIEDGCFFKVTEIKSLTSIPIGKPISNSKVIIINDDKKTAKINEIGEICFSGPGLAQGYAQDKQAFINKIFLYNNEYYFRTGDYGYISNEENIFFKGRIDNQVKIRGQRVEIEEVEKAINKLPNVKKSAVVFDDKSKSLIGYLVLYKNINLVQVTLKSQLLQNLPEYMIPARFIQIDKLPVTPNGKINRLGLPVLNLNTRNITTEFIHPKTALEIKLTEIFEEVLGLNQVGLIDNFFHLGGDSLTLSKAIIKIRERCESIVTFRQFYKNPSPVMLAKILDKNKELMPKKSNENIPYTYAHLNTMQKRLWIQQKLLGESSNVYNLMSLFELSGEYHEQTIKDAINTVLEKHLILLTRLNSSDNENPKIEKHNNPIVNNKILIFSDLSNLHKFCADYNATPIDIYDRLCNIMICKVNSNNFYYIILKVHHLVFDGWSVNIFSNTLATVLRAKLLATESTFHDKSTFNCDISSMNSSVNFWCKYLNKYSGILNLPTDFDRKLICSSANAKRENYRLTNEIVALVKDTAINCGVTPYTIFLAAYSILLYRYTSQDDIVVGVPISTRNSSELEDLIGFYVNTVPLRFNFKKTKDIQTFINNIKNDMFAIEENKYISFDQIANAAQIERHAGHHPVFQTLFTYQSIDSLIQIDSQHHLRWEEIGNNTVEVDISMIIQQHVSDNSEIIIEYNGDLYSKDSIERMLNSYLKVIFSISDNQKQLINHIDYIAEADKQKLLDRYQGGHANGAEDKTLTDLINRSIAKNPKKIAVEFGEISFNYEALAYYTNTLSHMLMSKGIGYQDYVAVTLHHSEKLIVVMLALWKIGAIYVPLSPDLPKKRIAYIINDTSLQHALVESSTKGIYSEFDINYICLDHLDDLRDFSTSLGIHHPISENDIAYVMYTSGTTGNPKGISISQRSISNRIDALIKFYGFDTESRHFQYGDYSFDTSLEELILPIASGGTLVVAPRVFNYDPKSFVELIEKHYITSINFIPSLHRLFLDYLEINNYSGLKSLQCVISGAETLTPDIVKKFYQLFPKKVLFNSYGPTENTINSTLHRCNRQDGNSKSVPIGKCIENSACYVLDKNQRLVSFGIIGELYVGGVGLAQGYLNLPELTREKFITNPYNQAEKIYATGDLVKQRDDGTFLFMGRNDSQVKLHGFRIELIEIEATIRAINGVSYAIVLLNQDSTGDSHLAAYVKLNNQYKDILTLEDIRSFLKTKLPYYMLPSTIMIVNEFKYLPSGKIDANALSLLSLSEPSTNILLKEPRTAYEKDIWSLWQCILDNRVSSVEQNFFNLGGDSILIIRMLNALRKKYNVDINLAEIYYNPTIESIAALVENLKLRNKTVKKSKAFKKEKLPLSHTQKRFWFLENFNSKSNNIIPLIFKLEGPFDIEKFKKACQTLCLQNQSLRLNFYQNDGIPYQSIKQENQIYFKVIQSLSLDHIIKNEVARPFDLKHDELIRFYIIEKNCNNNILLITMHHIISDGWSSAVLIEKLSHLYNNNSCNLYKEGFDYIDYIYEEQLNGTKNLASYWIEKYKTKAPLLNLPIDKPRLSEQSYYGDSITVTFDISRKSKLDEFVKNHNISSFTYFMSAYFILLRLYTAQSDLTVGTVLANRNKIEHEDIIGCFINTLPLRLNLDLNDSFLNVIKNIHQELANIASHQDTPFEKLVEYAIQDRDISNNPLFQTMFVMQDTLSESLKLDNIKTTQLTAPHFFSKFDLSVLVDVRKNNVYFTFEYNTDLFLRETIIRIADTYVHILSTLINNDTKRLKQINLISPSDNEMLIQFNQTQHQFYKKDLLLDELTNDHLYDAKSKLALITDTQSFTYSELKVLTNKLANYLISLGVSPGDLVAVVMEKGWEQVVAVYATLTCGAAYLPINAHDPSDRINEVLVSGKCRHILTQHYFMDRLNELQRYTLINVNKLTAYNNFSEKSPKINRSNQDVAYVIFTSGSTGKPKGVTIKHSAAVNTILDINDRFKINSKDVVYAISSLNFDLSVYDIFGTLASGATLVIPNEQDKKNPQKWFEDIQKYKITFWNSVPALMQMFCDFVMVDKPNVSCLTIKYILLSGDWIPLNLPEKINRCFKQQTIVTGLGGATEASIWSIAYTIDKLNPNWKSIPYGKPLRNQHFYIFDSALYPAPIGVSGELYIGGVGIADGYWDDEDKTKKSFIKHPDTGEKIYKTGDMGRLLVNGNIEFLGRNDHQLKIRGHRIELGEIQSKLLENNAIDNAIVIDCKNVEEVIFLVAYIVPYQNKPVDIEVIKKYLKNKLPEYMIPTYFIELDSIPLTNNGKVNRDALPIPMINDTRALLDDKKTYTESKIMSIWCELFNLKYITRRSSFFEIGGHSMLAVQAVFLLRKEFNYNFPVTLIFEYPILADLASVIESICDYVDESNSENEAFVEEGMF